MIRISHSLHSSTSLEWVFRNCTRKVLKVRLQDFSQTCTWKPTSHWHNSRLQSLPATMVWQSSSECLACPRQGGLLRGIVRAQLKLGALRRVPNLRHGTSYRSPQLQPQSSFPCCSHPAPLRFLPLSQSGLHWRTSSHVGSRRASPRRLLLSIRLWG